MLKAYHVHDGEPYRNALLVYAFNQGGAKILAMGHDKTFDDITTLVVERLEKADVYISSGRKHPYVEVSKIVLRELGWMEPLDHTCMRCGLAEMGGEYPVCPKCHRCRECGHSDECHQSTYPHNKFCCDNTLMDVRAAGEGYIVRECRHCGRQATERLTNKESNA